jgi:hypothetical protein
MEKRQRKQKRDYDRNVKAFHVVQQAIEDAEEPGPKPEPPTGGKNPHAVALGAKGGKARAQRLTPEQRREIAQKAAQARWGEGKPP